MPPHASPTGPTMLCFDGSDGSAVAIEAAGEILSVRRAVVVTVWEPVAVWELYDPGALLSAGVASIGRDALGLDEIAIGVAEEKLTHGVELAKQAGFEATGKLVEGKPWHAICDAANDLDASTIVLGARGLSRVESVLLGSVSSAVLVHARRPVLVIPRHDES